MRQYKLCIQIIIIIIIIKKNEMRKEKTCWVDKEKKNNIIK